MSKRILLGCYGVPGRGGAGTVLYLLFERMQRDGLDVAYVNLVDEKDEVFFRYLFGDTYDNPRSLQNVYTCILKDPLWRVHPPLADLISTLTPDLLFGFGFIAAWLLELTAPRMPVVFMTAGSRHMQHLVETGAVRDFMAFRRSVERGVVFPIPPKDRERWAVEHCALIIVHSPLVKFVLNHFFPGQVGKIYANVISVADLVYSEAERFEHFKRPFAQRDIDLLFIASSWNRSEKNSRLMQKIIGRCPGLNVHIVGDVGQPYLPAQCHGAITRREDIYAMLGRSKTLACPSLIDAAPGVLFEASAMGCNVIASPNCGNWQLCHEYLLAEQCKTSVFADKIMSALTGTYKDNREHFRGGYADLVETLSVF